MNADASGRVEDFLRDIHAGPWEHKGPTPSGVAFSEKLGRNVRTGNWDDQKITTIDKVRQALETDNFREAAEMADFFLDEAMVIYDIFRHWVNDLNEFMLARDVSEAVVREVNAHILSLLDMR